MAEPNEMKAAEGEHNAKGVGSTDWLDADAFAREVITAARRHGFESVRMDFRPSSRKEFHDGIHLDWDGGSRGDDMRFHLQSTAHYYAKATASNVGDIR